MAHVRVELVCKDEDLVVAEVETSGGLTARDIRSGLSSKDRKRCPPQSMIKDGARLTCGRCHGALWFRGADGELVAANPGTVKAAP